MALAHKAEDLEVAAQSIGWLIGDLLELGHVVEADLQIQAFAKLVEQLRQPAHRRHGRAAKSDPDPAG